MAGSIAIDSSAVADAALLAVVADPTRLGILRELAGNGETCVCNLEAADRIPGNLLSYHLRVLREAELLTARREGRGVLYAVTPGAFERLHATLPAVEAAP